MTRLHLAAIGSARMLGFRSTENSAKPYHGSRFGEGRHFKPPGLSHFPSVAFGIKSRWPLLVSDTSCALHRLLLERTNVDSSRLPLPRNFKASQQQQHPHVLGAVERCFRIVVQNSGYDEAKTKYTRRRIVVQMAAYPKQSGQDDHRDKSDANVSEVQILLQVSIVRLIESHAQQPRHFLYPGSGPEAPVSDADDWIHLECLEHLPNSRSIGQGGITPQETERKLFQIEHFSERPRHNNA